MKSIQLLSLLFIICSLSSCGQYVQVFHTQSEKLTLDPESSLRYHGDEHLDIYYDFWSDGGVMAFYLVNKTDSTLMVDFEKSSLSINHRETNYYAGQQIGEARPFTDPNESGALSTFYHELPRVLEIAPQSGQWIEGYPITFLWYPLKNSERQRKFDPEKSPLKLGHRISYSIKETPEASKRELLHHFRVTGIKKLRKHEFQRIEKQIAKMKVQPTDRFYVRNPDSSPNRDAQTWTALTLNFLQTVSFWF